MTEPSSADLPVPSRPPTRSVLVRPLPDGRIHTQYSGQQSTGEQNVTEVGPLVVLLLNGWGEGWSVEGRPSGPEAGVDYLATGPLGELQIQVTRIPADPTFWREAAVRGSVEMTQRPDEFAEDLIRAIRHKAASISPADRARLLLVLDGQAGGAYDSPPVLQSFRSRFLTEARGIGFGDVFLLGSFRLENLLVANGTDAAPATV